MNRLLRSVLPATALLLLLSVFLPVQAKAQAGGLNEVLRRMENHYKSLSSLKASVKMDQFTSQTGEHDVREGDLIYIPQKGRDAAFRINWNKPSESLSVINKQYVIYRPNLNVAYTGSVNSVKKEKGVNGSLALLNMSREELKASYEISWVGQEDVSGGTSTIHILLVPRKAGSFKNADIWVDADGMPVQMKQTENNNDSTTILLSGLTKNSSIDAKSIQVNVPKGTKIMKS